MRRIRDLIRLSQKRPPTTFRKGEVVHIVENHIKVRGTVVKVPSTVIGCPYIVKRKRN